MSNTGEPIRGIARLMVIIAGIALVAMMLVVVADVVLRFVFHRPMQGAYDLVSTGLLVMVFFGIAGVIARRAEILIDLIDIVAPPRAVRSMTLFAAFGTLALLLFLGVSMVGPATDAWKWGGYSLELGTPVWVLWAIAFVGLAGILWVALVRLWSLLSGRGTDAPAPSEEGAL